MRVQIALKLEDMNNAEVVMASDRYTSMMLASTLFKAPEMVAQITRVKTSTTALRTAVMLPTSDIKSITIEKARDALDRDLIKLRNMVQDQANDASLVDADRDAIVQSAGMSMRAPHHTQQRVFKVMQGNVSGSVILTAEGGVKAHEWQYTEDVDTLANREATDTTTIAKTTITGLKRGTEYAFFHKPVINGEKTEWEGPIMYIIN